MSDAKIGRGVVPGVDDAEDWRLSTAVGDRAKASKGLLSGGRNKGEKRGFGAASGKKAPAGFRLARLSCGCRGPVPEELVEGDDAHCPGPHATDGLVSVVA